MMLDWMPAPSFSFRPLAFCLLLSLGSFLLSGRDKTNEAGQQETRSTRSSADRVTLHLCLEAQEPHTPQSLAPDQLSHSDGWMASLTQWKWVWVSSGSWWWTGKPSVLQSMRSQRVRHDWATELNYHTMKVLEYISKPQETSFRYDSLSHSPLSQKARYSGQGEVPAQVTGSQDLKLWVLWGPCSFQTTPGSLYQNELLAVHPLRVEVNHGDPEKTQSNVPPSCLNQQRSIPPKCCLGFPLMPRYNLAKLDILVDWRFLEGQWLSQ